MSWFSPGHRNSIGCLNGPAAAEPEPQIDPHLVPIPPDADVAGQKMDDGFSSWPRFFSPSRNRTGLFRRMQISSVSSLEIAPLRFRSGKSHGLKARMKS